MAKSHSDLATTLLEQHVKHELAALKGAKLRKAAEREVEELFVYAEKLTLNRVCSTEQIMGVIRRLVVDMDLDAGIPELAAEMATEVLNADVQSSTQLKDVLSRE
ncbi:MAG: hypothetical protein R3276_14235, partial [Marinobacter sp.]|nr:hypothetical protein [Marinobacter sp.]